MSVCDLAAVRSILVVKLDDAGDCPPFLRALRAAALQARILLAVREAVAGLALTCRWVDGVVAPRYDFDRHGAMTLAANSRALPRCALPPP